MVDNSFIYTLKELQKGEISNLQNNLHSADLLLKEYPCFQSAYILKAIYLKQINEVDFQEELPEIAVRVQNRSVLYDRVHFPYKQNKIEVAPSLNAIEEDLTNGEEQKLDQELEDILDKTKTLQAEEQEVVIESKSDLNQKVTPDLVDENEERLQEEVFSDLDSLKDLVDSIRKTQKNKNPYSSSKENSKKKPTITISKFSLNSYHDTKISKLSPFNQWLQKKKQVEVFTEQKQVSEKQNDLELDMQASNEAELLLEVKRSNFKLEDFIVDQIEKKQSKKSYKQAGSRHAISETYAKILVDQEKYREAIDVYKELSIKYPQKSSTFARQIKNLKNKL
ncbi:MAG: hypothetical protein R2772_03755 [Chitinophagales bacterium]|nr:hypothetical protein [Erysipelotrichaceae bacterium]